MTILKTTYSSGYQTLTAVHAVPDGASRWTLCADWQAWQSGAGPAPIEVSMQVDTPPENQNASWPTLQLVEAFVGGGAGNVTAEAGLNGAWRITYGSGGFKRQVICDLRTQRLYLGICDAVRVEALQWYLNNAPDATVRVAADIGDAGGGYYDEPTVTYSAAAPAGVLSTEWFAPARARWWTPIIWATGGNYWGAAGLFPALVFSAANDVRAEPAIGYVPSSPRYELASDGSAPVPSITVDSQSVPAASFGRYGVRFWLST